jgi:hypothetical protein
MSLKLFKFAVEILAMANLQSTGLISEKSCLQEFALTKSIFAVTQIIALFCLGSSIGRAADS